MKKLGLGMLFTIGGLSWLLLGIGFYRNFVSPPEPPAPPTALEMDVRTALVLAVKTKQDSRDPKSFEIDRVRIVDNMICMTYRGHNAFGGVSKEGVMMEKFTTMRRHSGQSGFERQWGQFCSGGEDVTDVVVSNFPYYEAQLGRIGD